MVTIVGKERFMRLFIMPKSSASVNAVLNSEPKSSIISRSLWIAADLLSVCLFLNFSSSKALKSS